MSGGSVQTRSNRDRVAILMDGAYVIKRLQQARHRFPASASVRELAQQIGSELRSRRLYRIFFYRADPYSESSAIPSLESESSSAIRPPPETTIGS